MRHRPSLTPTLESERRSRVVGRGIDPESCDYGPDLTYAVQQVCLHMHDPRESHLAALKRLLRYVRGTVDLSLVLHRSSSAELVVYTDATGLAARTLVAPLPATSVRAASPVCVGVDHQLSRGGAVKYQAEVHSATDVPEETLQCSKV